MNPEEKPLSDLHFERGLDIPNKVFNTSLYGIIKQPFSKRKEEINAIEFYING